MSTFVLIHGGWHGGWCWREVAEILRAQGHTVFTPSLSGNAEHRHQNHTGISLETHILDVLGVFEAEGINRAVLVGHSYGGMVITGVADRIPTRVERLVYLDAFVPTSGDSVLDLIRQIVSPELVQAFVDHFYSARQNDGFVPPLSGELFGQTPETSTRMARFCNPQALATFTTPILLSGAGDSIPRHFVIAGNWQASPFLRLAESWRSAGLPVTVIPGGHCLMMDAPQATIEALVKA